MTSFRENQEFDETPLDSSDDDSDRSSDLEDDSDLEHFVAESDNEMDSNGSEISSLNLEEDENYSKLMKEFNQNSYNYMNEDDDDEFNSLRDAIQKSMIGSGKRLIVNSDDLKFNAILNGIFPEPKRGFFFF